MVQGSAFNLDSKQHFRIVFLPDQGATQRIYRQICQLFRAIKTVTTGSIMTNNKQETLPEQPNFNCAADYQ